MSIATLKHIPSIANHIYNLGPDTSGKFWNGSTHASKLFLKRGGEGEGEAVVDNMLFW